MNIENTFKLPIGWINCKLKDILTVEYGKNQKKIEVEYSKIPILGTGGVIGYANKSLFDKPSVLIGRKGTIDKPKFINIPFWTIDTLFYTNINVCKAYPKFVYYLFCSIDWYKYNEATGVPSLSANNIANIKISIPPLDEQQKIARILSTIDEQINQTSQLIEKTTELKKGLIQQLMTKGIGHTKFKNSELGEIPENWVIHSMNEVGDIVDYRGKTPKKSKDGIKLITARNIKKGFIDYKISSEYIPNDEYLIAMSRGEAKKGDILFTTEAPLGNVAILDREGVALAQRVIKYRVYSFMDNKYFMYYLLSLKFQKVLKNNATGSTVLGIKGKTLKKLPVIVPNLNEQKKIASVLSTVDQEIKFYQVEKEKYEALKKGLMQQLLTGNIRVKT